MYTLTLTEEDMNTILFVGNRYSWSKVLSNLAVGENFMDSWVATRIGRAFNEDMEGNHSMFPMLNLRSSLAIKLREFYEGVPSSYFDIISN